MKRNANLPRNMILIAIYLLLVACGTPQPANTLLPTTATFTSVPPTATNTPAPPTATATSTFAPPQPLCEEVEGTCLEIRFEEGSCAHVGPEIVPAGEITLIFSNYIGEDVGFDLEILDEGRTWDDMRRHMGPSPSDAFQPGWSQDVVTAGVSPGGYIIRHAALAAGTYITVCWHGWPHLVGLGGELIVE